MNHELKFSLHKFKESDPCKDAKFCIDTGNQPGLKTQNMHFYLINDLFFEQPKELLNFLNQAIEGNPTRDEFWTMGFTAKIINKDDKKIIKVFFRLTDDYEPGYISPEEFKEILEIYIREKEEFEKDPEKYAEKLKKETK